MRTGRRTHPRHPRALTLPAVEYPPALKMPPQGGTGHCPRRSVPDRPSSQHPSEQPQLASSGAPAQSSAPRRPRRETAPTRSTPARPGIVRGLGSATTVAPRPRTGGWAQVGGPRPAMCLLAVSVAFACPPRRGAFVRWPQVQPPHRQTLPRPFRQRHSAAATPCRMAGRRTAARHGRGTASTHGVKALRRAKWVEHRAVLASKMTSPEKAPPRVECLALPDGDIARGLNFGCCRSASSASSFWPFFNRPPSSAGGSVGFSEREKSDSAASADASGLWRGKSFSKVPL